MEDHFRGGVFGKASAEDGINVSWNISGRRMVMGGVKIRLFMLYIAANGQGIVLESFDVPFKLEYLCASGGDRIT
jgi:hypothetical protein